MKAKGLLSFMLSLPENWEYSERGLTKCFSDGRDAIRSALKELEAQGYLMRKKERDEKGQICGTEYLIFESPDVKLSYLKNENEPKSNSPMLENPTVDKPTSDLPNTDKPTLGKTPNIKLKNKTLKNESFRNDNNLSVKAIETEVKQQIDYESLENQDMRINKELLANIKDLIIELRCMAMTNKNIRIGSEVFPSDLVRLKLDKLTSEHIRYVLDCFKNHSDKIKNIKTYLQKSILNSADTLDCYYDAEVRSDFKYLSTKKQGG